MSFAIISVIGLGYIGLPTAAMFASRKTKVIGVDINPDTVDTINRGEIHIVEPELDILVRAAVTAGYLMAVTKPQEADAYLIAVPTPFRMLDDSIPEPDLDYIMDALRSIAPILKKGDLVILESTSPVGTTEMMALLLAEERPDLTFPQDAGECADINIAHCPERVLPGQVVRELVANDRVIGGITKTCSRRAIELYRIFVEGECVITNARTAEMAKLTENSCRDVQIAFANELSTICDKLSIDVWELIALANRHPRINILHPGPGVGGHCIAVDPWFIVSSAPDEAKMIHLARKINDAKPEWVINKVKLAITDFLLAQPSRQIEEITIGCFGLAFKANIDDLRESPAMAITRKIAQMHKGNVLAVEPNIGDVCVNEEFNLVSLEAGFDEADIVVMLVAHKEFKSMEKPVCEFIIDVIGVW